MRQLKFRQPLLNRDMSFNKFHYWGIMEDSFVGREMSGCEKGDDQQFTGLLDKQGKEIYEGDIVKVWDLGFKDGNEDGEFGYYRLDRIDVATMAHFPTCWLEKESFGYEGEDLVSPEHTEVIGNIYENPELLETK